MLVGQKWLLERYSIAKWSFFFQSKKLVQLGYESIIVSGNRTYYKHSASPGLRNEWVKSVCLQFNTQIGKYFDSTFSCNILNLIFNVLIFVSKNVSFINF